MYSIQTGHTSAMGYDVRLNDLQSQVLVSYLHCMMLNVMGVFHYMTLRSVANLWNQGQKT